MFPTTDNNLKGNELIQEIKNYASFQPFVGLIASVMFAFFLFFRDKLWSWGMVLYILIPFIGFIVIYAVIAIYMKVKHGIIVPFINKKIKILAIFLLMLLIGLNIALWKVKSVEFINVTLKDLPSVATDVQNSQKYFVLYSSKNCIYCNQMKSVYKEALLKEANVKFYNVDLTSEAIHSALVKKRNISRLPLLVCYQNDKEVNRLEGATKLETVIAFLKQ